MKTIVRRLPLETADQKPFNERLVELCDVLHAAGYGLVAMQLVGVEMLLVFQVPVVPTVTSSGTT